MTTTRFASVAMMVILLTAATASSPAPPGPISLADLTLDRVMRVVVPISPGQPVVAYQLPACTGVALTTITGIPHQGPLFTANVDEHECAIRVRVLVNGTVQASDLIRTGADSVRFDPPVIVPLGGLLEVMFSQTGASGCGSLILNPGGNDTPEMTVAGWLLEPGDL